MLSSNLIRGSGLAATVVAPLFIIGDLLGLFTLTFQGTTEGIVLQNIVAVGAGVLLSLGLIAMYARHVEAMGTPGLIGFLVTLIGLLLAIGVFTWAYSLGERGWGLFFVWASLLANLGWILLGSVSLEARVYRRKVAILPFVGAALYGVANAIVGSAAQIGKLAGVQNYIVGVLVFNIIFSAAMALFGLGLVRRMKEGD